MTEDMERIQEEVTVDELEGSLTGEVQDELEEENDQEVEETAARIREGLGELFEDGWTVPEMTAFTEDEDVRRAIAQGHSVTRAACQYLKGMGSIRRGVPTMRTTAAGRVMTGSRIDRMTDAEFAAFSRRAREAMMAGKRVSMD